MATYESYKPGDHEFSNVSFPVIVKFVDYDHTDLDASDDLYIPVDAGTVIIGVAHEVTEAFAGGSPSCTVGDVSQAAGWLASADISEASLGDFAFSLAKANAYSAGKKYNTAGVIIVAHAASLTAGKGRVYIFHLDTNENWRTEGHL